jgi:hypothetical protein
LKVEEQKIDKTMVINISSPDIKNPITLQMTGNGNENTEEVENKEETSETTGELLSPGLKLPQQDMGDTTRLKVFLTGLTPEKVRGLDNTGLTRTHILANKILTKETLDPINELLEKELEIRGLTIRRKGDFEKDESEIAIGKAVSVSSTFSGNTYYNLDFFMEDWAEPVLKEEKKIAVMPNLKGKSFSIHKQEKDFLIFIEEENCTKSFSKIKGEIEKLSKDNFIFLGKVETEGNSVPIFKVNDIVWADGASLEMCSWEERYQLLSDVLPEDTDHLKRVKCKVVSDLKELQWKAEEVFCQNDVQGVVFKRLNNIQSFDFFDCAEFTVQKELVGREESKKNVNSFGKNDQEIDSISCDCDRFSLEQPTNQTFPFVITHHIKGILSKKHRRKLKDKMKSIHETDEENRKEELKKIWKKFKLARLTVPIEELKEKVKVAKKVNSTIRDNLDFSCPETIYFDTSNVVVRGKVEESLILSSNPSNTRVRKCSERILNLFEEVSKEVEKEVKKEEENKIYKDIKEQVIKFHESGCKDSRCVDKIVWNGNRLGLLHKENPVVFLIKEIDSLVSWESSVPKEVLQFPFKDELLRTKIVYLQEESLLEKQEAGNLVRQIKEANPVILTSIPCEEQPFFNLDDGEIRYVSSGECVQGVHKKDYHEYFFFPKKSCEVIKGRWVWQYISDSWKAIRPEEQYPHVQVSSKKEIEKGEDVFWNQTSLIILKYLNYTGFEQVRKFNVSYEIQKVDTEQRLVYGPVLIPDDVDLQGDIVSTDEIRKAAWKYMEEYGTTSFQHTTLETVEGIRTQVERSLEKGYSVEQLFDGVESDRIVPGIKNVLNKPMTFTDKIRLRESFLAPEDFELSGREIKKGTWVMGMHVIDDLLWEQVKRGNLTGFSIEGESKRIPV